MRKAHSEWVRSLSLEHKRETFCYNVWSTQKKLQKYIFCKNEKVIHVKPEKILAKNKTKKIKGSIIALANVGRLRLK